MTTEVTAVSAKKRYRLESRVRTASGWRAHGPVHEYGDRRLADAAFAAAAAEHAEAYAASGEWRLVLLGPDRGGE